MYLKRSPEVSMKYKRGDHTKKIRSSELFRVTADYGDRIHVKRESIGNMENHWHRPMGLSLLQIFVKLGPPTDKVIRTQSDIRRSGPMDGNASHQLKANASRMQVRRGSIPVLKGNLVRIRSTFLDTARSPRTPSGPGLLSRPWGMFAALLEAALSGQRSRCICFYLRFRFLLDSPCCSQLRGKALIATEAPTSDNFCT
jgi:hypothetical protein